MREETIVEKVPNVMKTINPQIQVAQRLSQAWNLKKIIPDEVLIKFIKAHDKENILKAAREKRQVYALKIKNKSHSRFFMGNGASEKRMKIMSLKFWKEMC